MSTPGSGRRTPSRGSRPAGRGGPGRARTARPRPAPVAAGGSGSGPTPRLTSRAAVLVLVLSVLAVSYSSLARAYLPQRDGMQETIKSNRAKEARIAAMEREVARQDSPAFIEQQLRALGFVYPGETPYVVTKDGKPLDVEASLSDPSTVDPAEPKAWWDGAWHSMQVAGNPPKRTDPPPLTTVTDPEGAPSEEPEE